MTCVKKRIGSLEKRLSIDVFRSLPFPHPSIHLRACFPSIKSFSRTRRAPTGSPRRRTLSSLNPSNHFWNQQHTLSPRRPPLISRSLRTIKRGFHNSPLDRFILTIRASDPNGSVVTSRQSTRLGGPLDERVVVAGGAQAVFALAVHRGRGGRDGNGDCGLGRRFLGRRGRGRRGRRGVCVCRDAEQFWCLLLLAAMFGEQTACLRRSRR